MFLVSQAIGQMQIQYFQDVDGIEFSTVRKSLIKGAPFNFDKIKIPYQEVTRMKGMPELPVRSWLIQGEPQAIDVQLKRDGVKVYRNIFLPPSLPEPCRCQDINDPRRAFVWDEKKYKQERSPIQKIYLGKYRGVPLTRVDVIGGDYDTNSKELKIYQKIDVTINKNLFEFTASSSKNYLIVTPKHLEGGIENFVKYRESKGYQVFVESIEQKNLNKNFIQKIILNQYVKNKINYLLFVGDASQIPQFEVETSGSYRTPTDLPYLTLDGKQDHIPDVFSGRVTARTVEQVQFQLEKVMQFETQNQTPIAGFQNVIGVASNEGEGPSDADYIQKINREFEEKMEMKQDFIYQNDALKSNPQYINSLFDAGARWMTYMGHGTGTGWPSMYSPYEVKDISQIKNRGTVKPILIDIACQNGKLNSDNLGVRFMNPASEEAFGVSAYYGGSVNITWHPPAKMALGMVQEQMKYHYKTLGETLFAGQLYLGGKWTDDEEFIDNLEWFHLQGDPAMETRL